MKVHILTGVFYPEVHPRAFRAYELAYELAKQGHSVVVSLLTKVDNYDYSALEKQLHIKIVQLNLYHSVLGKNEQRTFTSTNKIALFSYGIYRFLLEYFLSGNLFPYAKKIAQQLVVADDTDLFIALSTPFMDFYGAARYRKKHGYNHTVYVADSGDPFYYSQQTKKAVFFKYMEKWVYKYFDYLTIPTEKAIPAYENLIDRGKIRIIPQAFSFTDVKLAENVNNSFPIFAYAGVFYKDIRNPEFFLKMLSERKDDFLFRIFLRHKDPQITIILDQYIPLLGKKMEVNYGVSRDQLLFELSQCNFLINIGNTTATQLPSKLIDYGITRRPIYSFVQSSFDQQVFNKFMCGDYTDAMHLDIAPYDIKVVSKQFLSLVECENM